MNSSIKFLSTSAQISRDNIATLVQYLIYPLLISRPLTMSITIILYVIKCKQMRKCWEQSRQLLDALKTITKKEKFLPYAMLFLLVLLLMIPHPEEPLKFLLLRDSYIVFCLAVEGHLVYLQTTVYTALCKINQQVGFDLGILQEREKAELNLYLEEPFMSRDISFKYEKGFDFRSLRETYMKIHLTHSMIHECFQGIMFLIVTTCRLSFFVNTYFFLTRNYRLIFCAHSILAFVQIFIVCFSNERLKNEQAKLTEEIGKYDLFSLDRRTRSEVQLFDEQLSNQSIEFMALDMFPINYKLIVSVLSTTTTYMLILKQMGV